MNAVDFVTAKRNRNRAREVHMAPTPKPIESSIETPIAREAYESELTVDDVLYKSFKKKKNKNGKGSVLVINPNYKHDPSLGMDDRKVVKDNQAALIRYIKQESRKINNMDY
jgi:hypothetical protein